MCQYIWLFLSTMYLWVANFAVVSFSLSKWSATEICAVWLIYKICWRRNTFNTKKIHNNRLYRFNSIWNLRFEKSGFSGSLRVSKRKNKCENIAKLTYQYIFIDQYVNVRVKQIGREAPALISGLVHDLIFFKSGKSKLTSQIF